MPRCLPPLSIRMYPTEVPREPHRDRMSSWIRMHLNHGFRRVPRRRVCRRLTSGMQDGFVDVYSSGSGAAAGLEPGPRKAVRVWRRRTRNRFASAVVVSERCPTHASTARDAVRLCGSHMRRAVYPGRGLTAHAVGRSGRTLPGHGPVRQAQRPQADRRVSQRTSTASSTLRPYSFQITIIYVM